MASAEIIEEISKFYDIKQKIGNDVNTIIYYIIHIDVNIFIGMKFVDNVYYIGSFNNNIKTLRKHIDRIILLINKLNEIFVFEVNAYDYNTIFIGSTKIYYSCINNIHVNNLQFSRTYYDECDVIEYLKKNCPECIKSSDIKIALKD